MPALFGKQCWFFLCSFKGELTKESCAALLKDIIADIGMTPSHDPVTFDYDGDMGWITAAPLQESMVFCDYWIRHAGGYLTVDSCKPFDANRAVAVIRKAGLDVHMLKTERLSLP